MNYYRLIITSQNKILTNIKNYFNKDKALRHFNLIIKENNKNVRFPIKFTSRDHKLLPAKYELILLRSKEYEDEQVMLRNDIGTLVPHTANSDKLVIYKKETYLFEESFWVYGLSPKTQRKDFNYILLNILLKNVTYKSSYIQKRILIYKNKLLIENDNDFDIIICKNEDDSIRLYNELEKEVKKLKIKTLFFSGFVNKDVRNSIEERIMLKTGWNLTKIRRNSTRP